MALRNTLLTGVTAATAAVIVSLAGAGTAVAQPDDGHNIRASSVTYGYSVFVPRGEHLYACDTRADGHGVTAQLYWRGKIRASVKDHNGAKAGCGHKNLSIAEGTPVKLRTCVSGIGCTRWVRSTA